MLSIENKFCPYSYSNSINVCAGNKKINAKYVKRDSIGLVEGCSSLYASKITLKQKSFGTQNWWFCLRELLSFSN